MGIKELLQQHVDAYKRVGYEKSLAGAILEHGRVYELDRAGSAALNKGYLKDCFRNATHQTLWDDSLTYCEGFAMHGFMPVHHAWVANEAGNALEVTWRDGGNECGFCDGGNRELDPDEEGYGEEDEETWRGVCRFCNGSGKSRYEHASLEGVEYMGVPVDGETLRTTILRNGVYGVLNTPDDVMRVKSVDSRPRSKDVIPHRLVKESEMSFRSG